MSSQQPGHQGPEKQRFPQLKKLEFTEPNADGDVIAIAHVSFGNKPAENIPVEFFYKDMLVPDSIEITKEGRAVKKFFGLKPGVYSVAARIQGSMNGNTESFRVNSLEKASQARPIPFSLKVEVNGNNGEYVLSAFVADKDGGPIKEIPVIFAPEDDFLNHKKMLTNENGMVIQPITISSLERFMVVMVEGTKLTERIHLFGPISKPAEATMKNERSLVLWQ